MRNTVARLLPLCVSPLFGCLGSNERPAGPGLEVSIAPLSLSGITEACYNLTTTNEADGQGQVVWTSPNVCSTRFGDGRGALTYVGTCDASPDGRVNSVTLELTTLVDKAKATLTSPTDFVNPCPVGEGRCILDVACRANADALVAFDLTVLRNAQQGFFDVAVNFEDIFCSSKIDCTYDKDGKDPIELLFDENGQRAQSVVVALACTSGPGDDEGTVLHVNGPRVVCGETPEAQRVEFAFATTCVGTGEVFGVGADLTLGPDGWDSDPVDAELYPILSIRDGEGGSTTSILPLSNGTISGDGGVVLGRLDDTHVAGFVFVGEAWVEFGNNTGEAHLAIWTRQNDGTWSLTSTQPTGGLFDIGAGFAWVAEHRLLGFGLYDTNDNGRYAIAPVSPTFELGPLWTPTPPAGTDRCRPMGVSGDLLVYGCDDSQANIPDGQDRYTIKVYELDSLDDVTPPGLGLVQSADPLCGDRLVATIYDEAELQNTVREWRLTGGTWTESLLGNGASVDVALERTMVVKEPDQSLTLWACEPGDGWTTATQPDTGRTYDGEWVHLPYAGELPQGDTVDGPILQSIAAFAGIAQTAEGPRPFIGSIDLNEPQATWHEDLLPLPSVCDDPTTPPFFEGIATRESRSAVLVGACYGANGDRYQILWTLGWGQLLVEGASTPRFAHSNSWRYTVDTLEANWGVTTRNGLDSGLSIASEGFPNCPELIGGERAGGEMIQMALWNLEDGGASGTELSSLPLGPFGASSAPGGGPGGGGTSYSLEIDPTFEGNLWSEPRADEPVFQVGSYLGQESLQCDGEPCNKVYWNVVVGFDPSTPDCWLEWEATASAAPGLVDGQTDPNTVYPFLRGRVQLTSGAKEGSAPDLLCRQNPVNGGGGLGTEYTRPGEPHTFCHGSNGEAMWSVDGCTWDGVGGGPDEGGDGGDGEVDPPAEPNGPDGVGIGSGTITTGEGAQEVNVTITNDFWIGRFEVTRGEWKALSGGVDPSGFQTSCEGDACPMNLVSWWSALGYLNALSMAEGYEPCYLIGAFATPENPFVPAPAECTGTWRDGSLVCSGSPGINGATVFDCEGYRLPTEGEWELAARAGTTNRTYGGDPSGTSGCVTLSGAGSIPAGTPLGDLAWYDCNSESRTHKVGTLTANNQGLYDMLGNVWEWVYDWYGPYDGTNLVNSTGPATGEDRIRRGGGFSTPAENVSAPGRGRAAPWQQTLTTGFRAARSLGTTSGN